MMTKLLKMIFVIVVIIALLPVLVSLIVALSPLAIVIVVFAGLAGFRPLRHLFVSLVTGITGLFAGIFTGTFRGLGGVFGWLFFNSTSSARFMGWFERSRVLNPRNGGLLVDGRKARLSEQASFESTLVQGGMGRGKTSTFVMPNLLAHPNNRPSFVVTDTSGEIYRHTSGYLAKKGYRIRALNLMDAGLSETYNPMSGITRPGEVAELAKTLVRSANGRSGQVASDPFWDQAAEKLIRIMAQCLINQPDPRYRNLANLRHLITSFDAHIPAPAHAGAGPKPGHTGRGGGNPGSGQINGANPGNFTPNPAAPPTMRAHSSPQCGPQLGMIDNFVLSATAHDQSTFLAYKAFVQGNLKTIQSVLMSADVALDPVATPEIADLTATSSFSFDELRTHPTVIYVIVNQTQMELYSFLLNLFYADLFRSLLQNQHDPGRPVWLFLDEFGHLQVTGFTEFVARRERIDIVRFFIEHYSGRKSDRRILDEMFSFLEDNPDITCVIVGDIDRFTRGGTETYLSLKRRLRGLNVNLIDTTGIIQPERNRLEHLGVEYQWSVESPSQYAEIFMAEKARAEASDILTRTIGQQIQLTREGYHCRSANFGFQNHKITTEDGKRKTILIPHEKEAPWIIRMFELKADGSWQDEVICEAINALGYQSRQQNHLLWHQM